jgi:GDPmannose 4,6-dehydratase
MVPLSIYGISKFAAQQICNMYRDAYGMFIVSSILFNHEGTRRGDTFVTQKIAKYVRELRDNGYSNALEIGNLNAKRDWGDARDYVSAVYLMLMSDNPQNYVIATGETHTVREFAELAFREIGIELIWKGEGVNETAIDKEGRLLIKVNPYFYRDIDIHCLIGDASKAKRELNWTPSITFTELVKSMVN